MVYIVTPFYNSYKKFQATFWSIVSQTYEHWEWVIIDDCSEKEQSEGLKELVKNHGQITVIKNKKNIGAGKSRNIALNLCPRGAKYIAFIDADDTWHSDFLLKSIELIDTFNIDITYGGYYRKSSNTTEVFTPSRINNSENIFRGCDISCLSTVIKIKSHPFNYKFGELRTRNDLMFFASILKDYMAYPNPLVLAEYNIHESSLSFKKWKLIYNQILAQYLLQGTPKLSLFYNWLFWIFRGTNKYNKFRNGQV